jgi:hypothetical protein
MKCFCKINGNEIFSYMLITHFLFKYNAFLYILRMSRSTLSFRFSKILLDNEDVAIKEQIFDYLKIFFEKSVLFF